MYLYSRRINLTENRTCHGDLLCKLQCSASTQDISNPYYKKIARFGFFVDFHIDGSISLRAHFAQREISSVLFTSTITLNAASKVDAKDCPAAVSISTRGMHA